MKNVAIISKWCCWPWHPLERCKIYTLDNESYDFLLNCNKKECSELHQIYMILETRYNTLIRLHPPYA